MPSYPSDISNDEWAFVAPYLTLMREDAPQRRYPMREVLKGVRWVVRTGAPWRMLPTTFPPWEIVYQPADRWLRSGVFETMAHDLRERLAGLHLVAFPCLIVHQQFTLAAQSP